MSTDAPPYSLNQDEFHALIAYHSGMVALERLGYKSDKLSPAAKYHHKRAMHWRAILKERGQ